MTDTPKRAFGPGFVYSSQGRVLYTVPTVPVVTAFIRDITLCNSSSTGANIGRLAIGDPTSAANRLINQSVAASTTYSARGLWILNGGETLQAQMPSAGTPPALTAIVNGTAGAAASVSTGSWTPAANTQYFLTVMNEKADAPEAVSSLSGNGTWTLVATVTTGSVAANNDIRITMYQWYSTSAGSAATTTANFNAVNQVESLAFIDKIDPIPQAAPSPYTLTPVIQSATANDSAAPSSTSAGLTTTLSSALTSGILYVVNGRQTGGGASTPPSGYTEGADMVSVSTLRGTSYIITAPPSTTTTTPANTWGAAGTSLRAAISVELCPDLATQGMSFTINVIEVTQ